MYYSIMALIIDKTYIFYHIPKTGGNSFRHFLATNTTLSLKEIGHKHATPDYLSGLLNANTLKKLFPDPIKKLAPIVIIRNPIDWYLSWYNYNKSRSIVRWGERRIVRDWHPLASLNSLDYKTFQGFLDQMLDKHQGFVSNLYRRYLSESRVHVVRLEDIANGAMAEMDRLGLKHEQFSTFDFPKIRPSERIQDSISEHYKAEIQKSEEEALIKFGYLERCN
jgi:hypothetical protein